MPIRAKLSNHFKQEPNNNQTFYEYIYSDFVHFAAFYLLLNTKKSIFCIYNSECKYLHIFDNIIRKFEVRLPEL